jgi:hypothetical protein
MPVGDDVTVPVPVLLTVSVYELSVKVAVTFLAWVIDTSQVAAAPEHPPPDQLVKVEPVVAAADRVTLSLAA